MRIQITRSGGVGGLTRTWSLEVSRAEAEQRWLPLAEAEAEASPGEGVRQPDAARDRFTYRITVGYTEVSVPESRLAEPWRELIDRARAAARTPPAPGRDEGGPPVPDGPGGAEHGKPEELL
ncbi:protealysin inhibitor emfourin [Arthrobacter sp. SX1312]|uniref:protealysin inhibitor emfourin n=1 Tax=Arthrobacter sp. SX1312 TaxID=2058896 RepID=UPI000CE50409|nr:protealysin inhibitor emfourin [Arthrobacter sp. SX1312]